ncbi:40S ribosomal protein S3a [Hordeum vulgare]|nr:40S ribosomal protein S3a [Hordeum vulgare]
MPRSLDWRKGTVSRRPGDGYGADPPFPFPKAGSSCDIVVAHRNLLLFRLTSNPVKGEDGESLIGPQEYFICQGLPLQQTLQLHRIPMFTHCSLHLRSVGISCRPEEKIIVAQLPLSESNLPAKMEAELCLLRSNEWELIRNLQIKYEAHELSDLIYWRTDSYYHCGASKHGMGFEEKLLQILGKWYVSMYMTMKVFQRLCLKHRVFEVSQADLQNDEDQAYRKIMPEPFVVSPLAPSILVPSLCYTLF